MSESLLGSLGKAWENFRYGESATAEEAPGTSATSQPPASIAHVVTVSSPASAAVSDAFKAVLVETVARNVPKLKELLENAALIAEDVPDPASRMRIVTKQARLSPADLAELLSQTDEAVASVIQQVMNEVSIEERDKVTAPSERLETLRATKQAKEAELASLTEQIGQAEASLANAQREIATSREKSQAGAQILQDWNAQMKNLLSSNK